MLRSTGIRAIIVGVLTVLMAIPAVFVADVIDARAEYNRETAQSVGREWGGAQVLTGPVLRIPVSETVTKRKRQPALDPVTGIQTRDEEGHLEFNFVEETEVEWRNPIFVLPDQFKADVISETETRKRGIFPVPVYAAEIDMTFDFRLEDVGASFGDSVTVHWDEAVLLARVTSNRALRGTAGLSDGSGERILIEPSDGGAGIVAYLGDPRDRGTFQMQLGLFGSNHLSLTAVGRTNAINLASDWPDPSFQGTFLPNAHDISDKGFEANWSIPHLARAVPQVSRTNPLDMLEQRSAFGVALYQPNDFYQKSYRAARYGVMFIGLTFLIIFLMDLGRSSNAHPVQYVLVGLSQLVFFLLMLSLAEQVGFELAYLASASATVFLIVAFAWIALGLKWRSLWLCGALSALYSVLYLILESTDYTLLAGSVLAFAALAGTMWVTRKEDWQDTGVLAFLTEDPKPAVRQ